MMIAPPVPMPGTMGAVNVGVGGLGVGTGGLGAGGGNIYVIPPAEKDAQKRKTRAKSAYYDKGAVFIPLIIFTCRALSGVGIYH